MDKDCIGGRGPQRTVALEKKKNRKHAFFLISSVFGSTCYCEQLFSLMKVIKSRNGTHLSDEHLEENMQIPKEKLNLILKDCCSKTSVKYLAVE
jgi:hypothetical protein